MALIVAQYFLWQRYSENATTLSLGQCSRVMLLEGVATKPTQVIPLKSFLGNSQTDLLPAGENKYTFSGRTV